MQCGFERDSCFYIQNEGLIRGKDRIDLVVDPPPDLVIEVDITSPSLNEFPNYAQLGVPEVWRYDGSRITIFTLKETVYAEAPLSTALPPLTGEALSRFVEESKTFERTAWTRNVRDWARERSG